jgi:hypothetical protein
VPSTPELEEDASRFGCVCQAQRSKHHKSVNRNTHTTEQCGRWTAHRSSHRRVAEDLCTVRAEQWQVDGLDRLHLNPRCATGNAKARASRVSASGQTSVLRAGTTARNCANCQNERTHRFHRTVHQQTDGLLKDLHLRCNLKTRRQIQSAGQTGEAREATCLATVQINSGRQHTSESDIPSAPWHTHIPCQN